MKKTIMLLTASLGLAAAPGAWASVIALSNLATPTQYGVLYNGQWLAREFTTGASTNLASVDIQARIVGAPTGFALALYSDASGKPGTAIATLTGAAPSAATYTEYSYTAPANTMLSASTSYWLVLRSAGVLSYNEHQIGRTTGNSYTGLPGWSFANGDAGSSNQGGSWTVYPNDPNQTMFQINVGMVPEPSTLALVGLGGLGMLWRLRRRQ